MCVRVKPKRLRLFSPTYCTLFYWTRVFDDKTKYFPSRLVDPLPHHRTRSLESSIYKIPFHINKRSWILVEKLQIGLIITVMIAERTIIRNTHYRLYAVTYNWKSIPKLHKCLLVEKRHYSSEFSTMKIYPNENSFYNINKIFC